MPPTDVEVPKEIGAAGQASHDKEIPLSLGGPSLELGSMRALLLPFFLPISILHLARSLVLVVLPLEVLALGYSYHETGILSGVMGFGIVFGNIPAGKIVAAKGPRVGMLVGGAGLVVGAALATMASSLQQSWRQLAILAVCFLIVGLAETTAIVARLTLLGAAVPSDYRGRASSALGGVVRFGWTIGPLVAGIVAQLVESRAVFVLMGALSIVSMLVVARLVPSIKSTQQVAKEPANTDKPSNVAKAAEDKPSMIGVVRKHLRVLLIVGTFSAGLTFLRRARDLFFALEGHHQGLSQREIGRITSLSFGIDGMLFPITGKILDGLGRRPAGVFSTFGLGLAFLSLVIGSLVAGTGLGSFYTFAVLGGIGNGLSAGMVPVLAADLAPPSARSEFIAVFRMVTRSADIGAPVLLGLLAQISTLQAAEIATTIVGFATTLWVIFCVEETLKRKPSVADKVDAAKMLPEKVGKYEDLEDSRDLVELNVTEQPVVLDGFVGETELPVVAVGGSKIA